MEALLANQEELFKQLQKAEFNYRKSPKERIKRAYIETRLETLEEFWSDFRKSHKELIAIVDKTQKENLGYFTADKFDQFQELYTHYRCILKEALVSVSSDTKQSPSLPHNVVHTSEPSCDIKLPKITLPTFTGKYHEWQAFHDIFTSLIHNNKNISAVQKLHYLKTSLSGEPETLVRNFATTELNYAEAWKQLTKRYDNKRFNCNAILKIFFSQKQITTESPAALKQLLDTTSSCLKSLSNIAVNVNNWDAIVVYFVVSKMDIESRKLWEHQQSSCGDELPTWAQLVEFLESRFRSLEMIDCGKQSSTSRPTQKPKSFHAALIDEKQPICVLCNGPHFIFSCKEFGQKGVKERQQYVQEKGLCFNCLSNSHSVSRCKQIKSCRRCGRRHHSLLHFEKEDCERNTNNTITKQTETQREENKLQNSDTTTLENRVVANFARGELHSYNVLLATAIVKSRSKCGTKLVFRTLLDQGSQASFVTEATVQLLGLKREPINGLVSGIGNGQVKIKYMTSLVIESFHNPQNIIQVNAYVMSSLSLLPTSKLHTPDWLELENLTLADPGFATPGKIDILLGAEVYGEVLLNDMIKHPQGNLIAQNTILGWVISGRVTHDTTSARREIASMHINIREDEFLKQFWEIENEPNSLEKILTEEELKCEEIYETTTTRNEEGRFVVKLPFKDEEPRSQYGRTKEIATRKLLSLEKRLLKDKQLYTEYQKVMQEYLTLNHMSPIKGDDIDNPKSVYLPHHAVVREDKDTTKVRVVYNASSKGVNNVSLNDDLLVGPKLQQDLRHLLMRWRKYRVCIIADLVKMYRQVRVTDEDANYQRTLWRNNPDEPIQHFKLLTLTFGTACAPYLAVKTLQKLADVERSNYPIASEITKTDYYIDDLMTGCDSFEEAVEIYEQMNKLMNSGGFQLQKWSSNDTRFLNYIDKEKHRSDLLVPIKVDNMMKVLGIGWNRDTDNFEYTVNLPESKQPITKRQILSDIARLYDPMGWISPVVITAKIFIQKLWKSKLEWDDEITDDLLAEWIKFREDLMNLKDILIPRWLNTERGCKTELHAFSDASQSAYAAAVYIRVESEENDTKVSLVTAKTKVAPIDKESSIPRLELCGAVLAAKLLHEVSQVMNIPKENLHAWTDSTVVLAWLKGPPCRWATFVSNRVSEILTMTEFNQWRCINQRESRRLRIKRP